jgi:hypothetical protein
MSVFTIQGNFNTGWSVYDVSNRRKLYGPLKGKGARELMIDIEMALRRIGTPSEVQVKETIDYHVHAFERNRSKKGAAP